VKAGELKKVVSNIYTTAVNDPAEMVVKRNIYNILRCLYPNAVISHRSAIDAGPKDGNIVLSYRYTKKIKLPGLTVHLVEGPGPMEGDMPFMGTLFLSSTERAWLENLQPTRDRGFRKTLTSSELEIQLDDYIRVRGEGEFRERLDKARLLAQKVALTDEMDRLQKMAGALLGTRTKDALATERGRSRAEGKPFDQDRVERFQELFQALMRLENIPTPLERSLISGSNTALSNLCFFDAYFSNFIEGTRFDLSEARQIVYEGLVPEKRPDSHDVIGTYQVLFSLAISPETEWKSADQLIESLKRLHAEVMKAHPDKAPGRFKEQRNFAGTTEFVSPELVSGTFIKGFEFYKALPTGFQRAAFVKFLVSEIHPFADGNGRLSRIAMNREFHMADQVPIIIPTVYRSDYIGAIKKLTKTNKPNVYIKMLKRAQAFTASLDYSSFESAREGFSKARAFSDDPEDTLAF
jgi:hypothetical protein